MEIVFLPQADEDREYWKQSGNNQVMKRITALLNDILEHPFTGIGKPEPLKENLQGLWSRRITDQHRIIYSVNEGKLYVYALRYHYTKK